MFNGFNQSNNGQSLPIFMPSNYAQQELNMQNSYQPPVSTSPQQQPTYWVNGIEGAKAFVMAPNADVILMDETSSQFFRKKADMAGKSELRYFEFSEIPYEEVIKKNDFVTKTEFNDGIQGIKELLAGYLGATASDLQPELENTNI